MARTERVDRLEGTAQPERTSKEKTRAAAVLIIVAIAAAFALTNLDSVKVHWIVGSAHSPLILVIVVSFVLGMFVGKPLFDRTRSKKSKTEG
jgi:uncharacterized integral membrane protein